MSKKPIYWLVINDLPEFTKGDVLKQVLAYPDFWDTEDGRRLGITYLRKHPVFFMPVYEERHEHR